MHCNFYGKVFEQRHNVAHYKMSQNNLTQELCRFDFSEEFVRGLKNIPKT